MFLVECSPSIDSEGWTSSHTFGKHRAASLNPFTPGKLDKNPAFMLGPHLLLSHGQCGPGRPWPPGTSPRCVQVLD